MIDKAIREKIKVQALREIEFDRLYKQGMVWRWQRNEDMYYARKLGTPTVSAKDAMQKPEPEARIHVELGKMQSFLHTYLSKIDNPLTFKYKHRTMADLKRAKLANALKEADASSGDWDMKDLMGKKQMGLYGRATYCYYADSVRGYRSHLENVDAYDFLIDPSAGGLDIDKAQHLGDYGVRLSRKQLQDGIKDGVYLRTETRQLLNQGGGNTTTITQEDTNKQNREAYINGNPYKREIANPDNFKFWRWGTTYEGERYYLVLTPENGGICIRIEKLADLFPMDEELQDAMWPYWSYAAFPDLTEFWTPSPADYVREIFMAQGVTVDQTLDNSERINKPQRAVVESAMESLADLVYKRNGIVRFKAGSKIPDVLQTIETPQLDNPMKLYQILETIHQTESGVTAATMGDAPNTSDQKLGIYEGNIAQSADRFGLTDKTYSHGYKRFAKLHYLGALDNLTKKTAVTILGPDGYESRIFVTKRDIKPSLDFRFVIESSQAETQTDTLDKRNKMTFLTNASANPQQVTLLNQKKVLETEATIVGFLPEEIRDLLDTSEYGESEQISEAERDIEDLINGKEIQPNDDATTAYGQHILDYMKDHKEDMDDATFLLFVDYMNKLEPVIIRNAGSQIASKMAQAGGPPQPAAQPPGAPPAPPAAPGGPGLPLSAPGPTSTPPASLAI